MFIPFLLADQGLSSKYWEKAGLPARYDGVSIRLRTCSDTSQNFPSLPSKLWVNILVGVTGKGWSQLRLNCWSWNLLGTFYRVKLDCVPKDFVRRRFVLAIFAIRSEMAYSRFSAINFISPQRSNAEQNPLVRTFIIPQTIPLPSYSFNGLNCTSKSSI